MGESLNHSVEVGGHHGQVDQLECDLRMGRDKESKAGIDEMFIIKDSWDSDLHQEREKKSNLKKWTRGVRPTSGNARD